MGFWKTWVQGNWKSWKLQPGPSEKHPICLWRAASYSESSCHGIAYSTVKPRPKTLISSSLNFIRILLYPYTKIHYLLNHIIIKWEQRRYTFSVSSFIYSFRPHEYESMSFLRQGLQALALEGRVQLLTPPLQSWVTLAKLLILSKPLFLLL